MHKLILTAVILGLAPLPASAQRAHPAMKASISRSEATSLPAAVVGERLLGQPGREVAHVSFAPPVDPRLGGGLPPLRLYTPYRAVQPGLCQGLAFHVSFRGPTPVAREVSDSAPLTVTRAEVSDRFLVVGPPAGTGIDLQATEVGCRSADLNKGFELSQEARDKRPAVEVAAHIVQESRAVAALAERNGPLPFIVECLSFRIGGYIDCKDEPIIGPTERLSSFVPEAMILATANCRGYQPGACFEATFIDPTSRSAWRVMQERRSGRLYRLNLYRMGTIRLEGR